MQLATAIPASDTNGSAVGSAVLHAGQRWGFRLRVAETALAPSFGADASDVARDLEQTAQAWRDWTAGITYVGPAREHVVRSAITLKLLTFEATGAVVAAATTSLPEDIGGVRNWDYRYTWLRDASFTLNALYALGCTDEARAYARWMCQTTAAHGLPLRVLYGIDGSVEFPEEEVWQVDGYRGSRPVRVGNGAASQLQLDSYGELLDCLTICESLGEDVMRAEWPHFRRLVEFVADNWSRPDSGIWEVRTNQGTSCTPRRWPGSPSTGAARWWSGTACTAISTAGGVRQTRCGERSSNGASCTAGSGARTTTTTSTPASSCCRSPASSPATTR